VIASFFSGEERVYYRNIRMFDYNYRDT